MDLVNAKARWMAQRRAAGEGLQFCPRATVAETPSQWALTPTLQHSPLAWAQSLREMYAHPMAFPGSLSPQVGELLKALLGNIAPRTVMEIGSLMGVSTLWMAAALAELPHPTRLYALDLFVDLGPNDFCSVWLRNPQAYIAARLEDAGLRDYVSLHAGDSKIIAPKLAAELDAPLDFLFIDGDHSIEGCYADFVALEPYLASGGYLLLHDIFPEWCGWHGPSFLLEEVIKPDTRFEVCPLYLAPLNFGAALVRKL